MRNRGILALCVAGCLLVAACGGDAPPIKVGSAPAIGSKVTLPRPASNGLTSFGDWPQACGLITDVDVHAILPQSHGIVRRSFNPAFKLRGDYGMTTRTAVGAGCQMTWWLPGSNPDAKVPTVNLDLSFDAVGSPSIVQENYTTSKTGIVGVPGLDRCVQSPESYRCLTHGDGWTQAAFTLQWTGDPSVSRFEGQPGGTGRDATDAFWHDRVAVEFVKVVAARLP